MCLHNYVSSAGGCGAVPALARRSCLCCILTVQPRPLRYGKIIEPAALGHCQRNFGPLLKSTTFFHTPHFQLPHNTNPALSRPHAHKNMPQNLNTRAPEDEPSGRIKRRRLNHYDGTVYQRHPDAVSWLTERDDPGSAVGNLSSRSSSCAHTASEDCVTSPSANGTEQLVCFGMVG